MKKNHSYTPDHIEYINTICKGKTRTEIVELFNRNFGTSVTNGSIRSIMSRNKLKSGLQGHASKATQFKKGQVSWCKGMKGLNLGGEAGWFKKGTDHLRLPLGSETKYGELMWVKTEQPNIWERKHLHIWRQAYGEIPDGMVIRFKDGDKSNVVLDNLFMVSQRAMTSVVRRGLEYEDADLNVAMHDVATLEMAILDKEREVENR